jgi:hypothetical protein
MEQHQRPTAADLDPVNLHASDVREEPAFPGRHAVNVSPRDTNVEGTEANQGKA